MNCEAGDLAYIQYDEIAANVGHLVEVLDRVDCEPGEWRCLTLSPLLVHVVAADVLRWVPAGTAIWAWDVFLRPIRYPGADARDESHAWLPRLPITTKETA